MEYPTRNHAFAPPMVLRLEGDSLVLEQEGRDPDRVSLRELRAVELSYFPTRAELNRYRCRLYTQSGRRIEFFNRTYRGIMDFEDTSQGYKDFLLALHEALSRYNPDCQFRSGVSARQFWFNVACLGFVFFVLVFAFLYFMSNGILWVAFIKALILLFYLPYAIHWVRRNVPKRYAPDKIPAEVLPQ